MVWVKLDDGTPSKPEILALSPAVRWFWIAGLCYIGRHLTDGFIPDAAIFTFGVANPKGAAARLVQGGMWERASGGYAVRDFLDYNLSREVVERKRAETKERVRRHREQRQQHVGNNVTSGVTNDGCNPSPVPTRPDPTQKREHEQRARDRFDRFWAAYPRKVGKDAAIKEWQRISPDDAMADAMIAAVQSQSRSTQWQRDNGEYIPHPRTWLHHGRWKDEGTSPSVVADANADAERREHHAAERERLRAENDRRATEADARAEEVLSLSPDSALKELRDEAIADVGKFLRTMSEPDRERAIHSVMKRLILERHRGRDAITAEIDRLRGGTRQAA